MENKYRVKVLQLIFNSFQQMTQWVTVSPTNYVEYHNQAKGLIELLEIEDCGSSGGFDSDSPLPRLCNYDLYDRFLALLNKFDNVVDPECGFTSKDLIKYFNGLSKMRDTL